MRVIDEHQIPLNEIDKAYSNPKLKFSYLPLDQSLNLALACKWLRIDKGLICLDHGGEEIMAILESENGQINAARRQLLDYLSSEKPDWSLTLRNGRKESMRYLSLNISDIFMQLNLYSANDPIVDEETVQWWDKIAQSIYNEIDQNRAEIGRKGERLTYDFEVKRIGQNPNWISLENNKVGFDFISIKSQEDNTILCIEVKTSKSSRPRFFLSKNEWRIAESKSSGKYLIYFWNISNPNQVVLTIFDSYKLKKHVPTDSGAGEWYSSVYDPNRLPNDAIMEVHEFNDLSEQLAN